MGCGKTTLGKCLAQKLGFSFIDVDLFLENRYRKSINQIFEEYGESAFRQIENKILNEIVGFENTVVSTGGGLPCFFDHMELMNQHGTTIYLKVDVEELANRLETQMSTRPLLKDKTREELNDFIRENLTKREPYYSKAKLIVSAENLFTKKDINDRVDNLILHLEKQAIL